MVENLRQPENTQETQKVFGRNVDKGRILMQWAFKEYEKHDRSRWWYVTAAVIGGLLLIYAILQASFLFALIILMFALIIFTHHRNEPLELYFTVYETGIQIGDRFFLFREINNFAIIYEPPLVKRLYIVPKGRVLRTELSIPLGDHSPLDVRSLLIDFIEEDLDRESESASDTFTRLLKL